MLPSLDRWQVTSLPASPIVPAVALNFAPVSVPPTPPPSAGCGSNSCPCAVASQASQKPLQCASSISPPANVVEAPGRRFAGGLVLRREWWFRTIPQGVDFVDQIKIIATNSCVRVVCDTAVCVCVEYMHGMLPVPPVEDLQALIKHFVCLTCACVRVQWGIRRTASFLIPVVAMGMCFASYTQRVSRGSPTKTSHWHLQLMVLCMRIDKKFRRRQQQQLQQRSEKHVYF
jgi:hypothetical protein